MPFRRPTMAPMLHRPPGPPPGGWPCGAQPSRPCGVVARRLQPMAPSLWTTPCCAARAQVSPEALRWPTFRRRHHGRRRRPPSSGEREAPGPLVRPSHTSPLRPRSPARPPSARCHRSLRMASPGGEVNSTPRRSTTSPTLHRPPGALPGGWPCDAQSPRPCGVVARRQQPPAPSLWTTPSCAAPAQVAPEARRRPKFRRRHLGRRRRPPSSGEREVPKPHAHHRAKAPFGLAS